MPAGQEANYLDFLYDCSAFTDNLVEVRHKRCMAAMLYGHIEFPQTTGDRNISTFTSRTCTQLIPNVETDGSSTHSCCITSR